MQITLDLEPALLREVIRALDSRAAYLRGYKDDRMTAKQLEDLAGKISEPETPAVPAAPSAPAKKPIASETSAAGKKGARTA